MLQVKPGWGTTRLKTEVEPVDGKRWKTTPR